MAVSLVSTGIKFPDDSIQTTKAAQSPAFTNRIINGAMVIDQRNAGAAVSTNGAYPVDRFQMALTSAIGSTFTAQQSSTAATGFTKSFVWTVGTAGTATGTQSARFDQQIEGYNIADFGLGTSGAVSFTLSFWVRSSVTGTYCVFFSNSALDRSYVAQYTISASNTWEQKTITVSGDTSGTWLKDNGSGLRVGWDLGSGSDRNTTAGSWASGFYTRTSGQTNFIGNAGATFYITGVQLEKGSTATAFDYRPYGTELALCQRYYWSIGRLPFTGNTNYTHIGSGTARGSTDGYIIVPYPVTMRSSPGLAVVGPTTFNVGQGGFATTAISADVLGMNTASLSISWAAGGTFSLNSACRLYTGTSNAEIQFSAEL